MSLQCTNLSILERKIEKFSILVVTVFPKSTPDFSAYSPCFPHTPPLAPSNPAGILTFPLNYSLFNFQGLLGLKETWHMTVDLTLTVLSVYQSLFTFFVLNNFGG